MIRYSKLPPARLAALLWLCAATASTPVALAAASPSPTAPRPTIASAVQGTQAPDARQEDVASMDAILAALYDVISGPAGQARDWDRFRSLFAPGARLIPTGRSPEGQPRISATDPDGYISRSSAALARGFFEKEIFRKVDRFGRIVHVFSTYESRRQADDTELLARGINSIQLFDDGARWWIVSIYWQAETPEAPIPPEYLPK